MSSAIVIGSVIGSTLYVVDELLRHTAVNRVYIIAQSSLSYKIFSKYSKDVKVEEILADNNDDFNFKFKKWFNENLFNEKPLLYITSDSTCLAINKNRRWYEDRFLLTIPSYEIIQHFSSKGKAELIAEQMGLKIPFTYLITQLSDITQIRGNFPLIVKPVVRAFGLSSPFKVKIVEDFIELEACLTVFLTDKMHFVVQQYIPGNDDHSYYGIFYRDTNKTTHITLGRKLLQCPPRQGLMAIGSVEPNDKLEELCLSFLDKIDYFGIGGIEFKKYKGEYYFIEMSTRIEAILSICKIANNHIVKISYKDLVEKTHTPKKRISKTEGQYYSFENLLLARIKYTKRFDLFIQDIFKLVWYKKNWVDVFSLHKIKVSLAYMKSLIIKN